MSSIATSTTQDEEEVLRDDTAKNTVTRVLLLVLFLDSLGPFLMLGNSPFLFTPPTEGVTESQKAGGMGIFYLNGDVERIPLGGDSLQAKAAFAIQSSVTITLMCQGLAGFFSSKVSGALGRKGALWTYTFLGGFMFILAGLSGEYARDLEGGMYILIFVFEKWDRWWGKLCTVGFPMFTILWLQIF